jgi:hypothetical protein
MQKTNNHLKVGKYTAIEINKYNFDLNSFMILYLQIKRNFFFFFFAVNGDISFLLLPRM